MSQDRPDILCIGAALWDVIGRSPAPLRTGSDMPGRIRRRPGGVALNIATALSRLGLRPALLSVLGRDTEGRDLAASCDRIGIITSFIHFDKSLQTDIYMAVEDSEGLIAAIADAHSLETADDRILRPLADGRLGSADAPWAGPIALDGNLTATLLAEAAGSPLLAAADLRVAPASPGKAGRLLPLLPHPGVTLYVNRQEADLLTAGRSADAAEAAAALRARGARRVLVTDGARPTAISGPEGEVEATPPPVRVSRVTGAGDAFMAAHVAAEIGGATPRDALEAALDAAARHVSGDAE